MTKAIHKNQDPLQYYFDKYGAPKALAKIVYGEKYCGVMLESGDIGVCASLDYFLRPNEVNWINPDLDNLTTRIVCNAYYNALLNNQNSFEQENDIFDQLDFSKMGNIVMVGYFESLVQKFKAEQIALKIFDKAVTNEDVSPLEDMHSEISKTDTLIITSTTLHNGTFHEVAQGLPSEAKLFLLGPSSILDKDMFELYSIEMIFGSVFEKYDQRVLNIIEEGGGTKAFMKYMKKVFLRR